MEPRNPLGLVQEWDFFFLQLTISFLCDLGLAAGTESHIHRLLGRFTAAQAEAATENEKEKEAVQELEITQPITVEKEKEVQQAIWAKLVVQEEVAKLRAELKASQAKMQALAEGATAQETLERIAEEEFEASFL